MCNCTQGAFIHVNVGLHGSVFNFGKHLFHVFVFLDNVDLENCCLENVSLTNS